MKLSVALTWKKKARANTTFQNIRVRQPENIVKRFVDIDTNGSALREKSSWNLLINLYLRKINSNFYLDWF